MKTAFAAALLFGAPILTGALGAMASRDAPSFYGNLQKPSWSPSPSIFGPVWTVLYLMMGLAAFLVWRARGWEVARWALALFLFT